MNKVSKLSSIVAVTLYTLTTATPAFSSVDKIDATTQTVKSTASFPQNLAEQIKTEFIKILALSTAQNASIPNPLYQSFNWSSSGNNDENIEMQEAKENFEKGIKDLRKKIKTKLLNKEGCIPIEIEKIISKVVDGFSLLDKFRLKTIKDDHLGVLLERCKIRK